MTISVRLRLPIAFTDSDVNLLGILEGTKRRISKPWLGGGVGCGTGLAPPQKKNDFFT